MIRFTCEHCNQKIRIAGTAAGKKGRCPHCKQVVVVPELALQDLLEDLNPKHDEFDSPVSKSTRAMICYECQMCSKPLSASKAEQGEIKECPHCGSFVEVPALQKKVVPEVDDKIQLQSNPPVQDDYEDPFNRRPARISAAVPKPLKRSLPIFLDVFLYPLSKFGVLALIAFSLAPLLLRLLSIVSSLTVLGYLAYLFILICVKAYICWYFALCIQKSAEGGIRAPDTFNEGGDITDMVRQMIRIILLIVTCLLPPFIYMAIMRYSDVEHSGYLFLAILGGCVFFLPMMLLASVMFDSFWVAWNPRVILGGMFSSFFAYLALVIAFYIPIVIYFCIGFVGLEWNLVLKLALNAISMYLIMVSSHLLGWFFYKNEKKLYWSV